MWLKTLRRWLERLVLASEEPHAAALRLGRLNGLELRKVEVRPWIYPPPY
jgi:hypothetical protein